MLIAIHDLQVRSICALKAAPVNRVTPDADADADVDASALLAPVELLLLLPVAPPPIKLQIRPPMP